MKKQLAGLIVAICVVLNAFGQISMPKLETILPQQTKAIFTLSDQFLLTDSLKIMNIGQSDLRLCFDNQVGVCASNGSLQIKAGESVTRTFAAFGLDYGERIRVTNFNLLIAGVVAIDAPTNEVPTPQPCLNLASSLISSRWQFQPGRIFVCNTETKVGIGTEFPSHHFTNVGTSLLQAKTTIGLPSSTSAALLTVNSPSNTQAFAVYTNGIAAYTIEHQNGTNQHALSGSVQIETQSNQSPLSVQYKGKPVFKLAEDPENGNQMSVFANEIVVKLGNFPDYVFDTEYALLPLHDLRQYIHTFKHLPGIPSASEVEAKGNQMPIGELQRTLLEKVEELTLYILQLEERISELESK